MKLSVISLFFVLFLALPAFNQLNVLADGTLYGRVFMDYQGRQIPLKGVFINKVVDCNKPDNKNLCQSQSCVGRGFCPSKPQPYYTKDDGSYNITQDGTLVKNNQPASCNQGGFEIGCGINCGLGTHEFSAYFPDNFNLNIFPSGTDLRKGHFEAATPKDQLSLAPTSVLTDSNGNQYYHLTYTNNSSNNPNLDFKWVPDPLPIAGTVVDSQTGRGIAGVSIQVSNDQTPPVVIKATTDSNGKFNVDSSTLFNPATLYAVRIVSIPTGYNLDTRLVTTTQWSWINVSAGRNAAPPDKSYELQAINNNGCAGPDNNPNITPHQVGRCNFKIDPIPPSSPTPLGGSSPYPSGLFGSPSPSAGNRPGSSPSSGGSGPASPPGSAGPNSSSNPGDGNADGTNPQCLAMPTSEATVTNILVDNQPVTLSSGSTLSFTLKGFPGQSNYVLPVVIKYSNNACRSYSLGFNYNPVSSSKPSPNPADCAKTTDRPDDCACTQDSQCQGGKCDPNRGDVCSTLPFIRTQGGDVHSNIQINQ